MADVVVIVPMLGRAALVPRLLESLACTEPRASALFVVSETDLDVLAATAGMRRLIVPGWARGDYPRKVNAAAAATTEPLLFLGAIDVVFHPGWLTACEARLTPGIGVVGTNDLGNPRTATGDLSTHTLITRDYINRCGTIDEAGKVLHEGYWHEHCDDELVATAKRRQAWAHAPDAHVEHLHPAWGKAPPDHSYGLAPLRMVHGRRVFRSREHLWTR